MFLKKHVALTASTQHSVSWGDAVGHACSVEFSECTALLDTALSWTSGGKGADILSMPLSQAIDNLNSKDAKTQAEGVKALRGRDEFYSETQGYVFVSHLREMQRGIRDMKAALQGCHAVFGIDRGGGLLVSYLSETVDDQFHPILQRISKPEANLRDKLDSAILTAIQNRNSLTTNGAPIEIGFVETFISGTSVNTLSSALLKVKAKLPKNRHACRTCCKKSKSVFKKVQGDLFCANFSDRGIPAGDKNALKKTHFCG